MKLTNLGGLTSLLLEMGAKKICATCGHPMANYHFYRNGGWHCKTSSLMNPGPGADKAKVAAALAGGSKAVSTTTASTAKQSTQAAPTPPVQPTPAYNDDHKQKIHEWLTKCGVSTFKINDDNTVDVDGDVDLVGIRLYKIPVKFSSISGSVLIAESMFKTLEGLPPVIGGDLLVQGMALESLNGIPKEVRGSVSLQHSTIKDATHSDLDHVGHNLILSSCQLKTFGNLPSYVGGDLNASNNSLVSIKGLPEKIGRHLVLTHNKMLTTLEGVSTDIGGGLYLDYCTKLTSIKGLGTVGGSVHLTGCSALGSLEGLPDVINGKLLMNGTPITTLNGFPSVVNGDVRLDATSLASFHHIYRHVKTIKGMLEVKGAFETTYSYAKSSHNIHIKSVLGLLFIRGLSRVKFFGYSAHVNGKWVYEHPIQVILNKALAGDMDVHDAQEELIDAGFAAQATL